MGGTTGITTRSAIDRVEHHLATTSGTSTDRNRAAQLLRQRNQLLDRLRDIDKVATQLDAIAKRQHGGDQDRGHGLEL